MVECDEAALVALLTAAGLLDPLRADCPHAIATAVEKLLRTLTAEAD